MGVLQKWGIAAYCVGLVLIGHRCLVWADERRQTYPNYPKSSEFYMAGLYSLPFIAVQWIVRFLLRPIASLLVVKKSKWSATVYEAKLRRFGSAAFKAMFFVLLSGYSYFVVLQASPWLPQALFGSGNTHHCWGVNNAGDTQDPPGEAFTLFYVVAMAYHLSELIFQVVFELDKPDFTVMMIHHSTTCFLLFASFSMNFVRIGSLVLFLHDVTDIPVYLTKIFVDTPYKITTFLFYLGTVVSWGYLRLYVFPRYIIKSVFYETGEEIKVQGNIVCYGFTAALSLLLCLHVFWYTQLLQMGWAFLSKGETRDMQANISEMDLQKCQPSKRD